MGLSGKLGTVNGRRKKPSKLSRQTGESKKWGWLDKNRAFSGHGHGILSLNGRVDQRRDLAVNSDMSPRLAVEAAIPINNITVLIESNSDL